MARQAPDTAIDPELFPASFLRLLSIVPAAVRRLHAGVADGRRAIRGEGGRFFFRGHREYRPGDDLRRVDWNVEARLGRLQVRQFDAQKDVLTEVWLDGSASMAPCRGRVTSARAAAVCCATGLGAGGRVRLGVLRGGEALPIAEGSEPGHMRTILEALTREAPADRADIAAALPRLQKMIPRGARFLFVSDLLTRADPGVLHAFAGRGLRGALLHVRVPEIHAPAPGRAIVARDVESGAERTVTLDSPAAARIAARAKAHADLWAHHARMVGLLYMPLAPGASEEKLLRRLVLEVP
jgi:uncharacterized protein (DUF58 family)